MVRRFLYRALGAEVSPTRARQLVTAAAAELGVTVRALDRAMWLRESPSGDAAASTCTEELA
jgi:predicted nuclease of restriction endonuclease-like RecB superfamily